MNLTRIIAVENDQGELESIIVSRSTSRFSIPDFQVGIGTRIRVKPSNPQKLKHRDRTGEVVSFVLDDIGQVAKVDVRFDDNKRRGKVDISDLAPLEA